MWAYLKSSAGATCNAGGGPHQHLRHIADWSHHTRGTSASAVLAVSWQEILWIQPRGLCLHLPARGRTVCAEPWQRVVWSVEAPFLTRSPYQSILTDTSLQEGAWRLASSLTLWSTALLHHNRHFVITYYYLLLHNTRTRRRRTRAQQALPVTMFMSCQLPQGGCLWFWPVIWAPSSSAIATDASTALTTMTTPSPKLTPVLGRLTNVLCEFLGAGLVQQPVKQMKLSVWPALYNIITY